MQLSPIHVRMLRVVLHKKKRDTLKVCIQNADYGRAYQVRASTDSILRVIANHNLTNSYFMESYFSVEVTLIEIFLVM